MSLRARHSPEEKQAILDANRRWAEQGGDAAARRAGPTVDPGWNPSGEADDRRLQLARQGFEEEAVRLAGQKPANWSEIRECRKRMDL